MWCIGQTIKDDNGKLYIVVVQEYGFPITKEQLLEGQRYIIGDKCESEIDLPEVKEFGRINDDKCNTFIVRDENTLYIVGNTSPEFHEIRDENGNILVGKYAEDYFMGSIKEDWAYVEKIGKITID